MDKPYILRAMRLFLLSSIFCAAAWSCGDDADDSDDSAAGTSGGAGSGGSTVAGQGGSAGSTLPPPPPPVPCGSSMCRQPTNPLSGLLGGMALPVGLPTPMACCADESKGTCGVAAMAGATCEPPATPDSRCPGLDLGALGAAAGGLGGLGGTSSGCCTPSNMCGLDGALFGRGCVENGEAKTMLSAIPLVGTLFNVPAPRACDAPPATDDAGTADAGI